MRALALLVVLPRLLTQPGRLSPRNLLRLERRLTGQEIAMILSASREALAGKTFELTSARSTGPQVLMGRDGRPKIIRSAGAIEGGTLVRRGPTAARPKQAAGDATTSRLSMPAYSSISCIATSRFEGRPV
jgi:hypothetical protein